MAKRKKPLIDPNFALVIFIISLLATISNILFGFEVVELTFLGLTLSVQETIFHINILLLGIGFIIEGAVVATLKRLRDGVSADEIVHIVTILLGVFLFGSGIYGVLAGAIPPLFKPFVAFGNVVALFIAIAQYFLVKQ